MKRRHRTLLIIALGAVVLGGATIIGSLAMKKTVSFFYAPKDVLEKPPKLGANVRLGGLVGVGSIKKLDEGVTNFMVTDGTQDINVTYKGVVPDLFREGQGVIAEGKFTTNKDFKAERILAKHDENYVPKEVADSLKESGQWRGAQDAVKK
jgi:cytochrome c-type biogenesis protein CcmE